MIEEEDFVIFYEAFLDSLNNGPAFKHDRKLTLNFKPRLCPFIFVEHGVFMRGSFVFTFPRECSCCFKCLFCAISNRIVFIPNKTIVMSEIKASKIVGEVPIIWTELKNRVDIILAAQLHESRLFKGKKSGQK